MPNLSRCLRATGLALGLFACASPASAATVAPGAALSAPKILGQALTVTLKDGQVAVLNLVDYDRFFLTALNAKGTRFDIPWTEVASVDGEATGSLAMMRGLVTPGPGPVSSVIEYRSPSEALRRSLWPGVLLHGSGLRYAGDNGSFVGLAGGEIFGLVLGAFGAYLQYYPNSQDVGQAAPQALVAAGAVCFLGTWVWDMVMAPPTARALDSGHGLALGPAVRGDGLQLSYRY